MANMKAMVLKYHETETLLDFNISICKVIQELTVLINIWNIYKLVNS